ncbi:MAG: hypothetical protein K0Q90_1606 [Paenibacillaceae bacterium]|jgi:hypothetical protein|nr:hypothetical protein [Paenibacillaceae bacterium]
MFYFSSFIIPVLVMLPSVSFMFLSPRNMPAPDEKRVHPVLTAAEAMGRAGTVVLPLFFPFHLERWYGIAALAGMAVCLLLYYAVWIVYYRGGRDFARLFAPIWGIPVPLAVFPSVYFLFASVVLHAAPLLAAGLIFGYAHIAVSLRTYRRTVR